MTLRTDSFDLGGLRLTAGEGRRLDLAVAIDPFELGGETYRVTENPVPVRLDVSKTTGSGYALRLRFQAQLEGPCMRCLEAATSLFDVDAREISQPGEGDELESEYVEGAVLDLQGWAHDALALVIPSSVLCREDCAGLCPICGVDLNAAGPEHGHEPEPDPRWKRLSELKFDR